MSLPETGTVSVSGGGGNELPSKAFLAKLPPSFWNKFADSTQSKENFKVSLDNGEFKIITPSGESIAMTAHTTGTPVEIHSMDASGAGLQPIALANARLTAPIAGPATKSNATASKSTLPRPMSALLAKSSAATSMSRTQSSPAGTGVTTTTNTTAPEAAAARPSPKVPLKTRVIQLLAYGHYTEAQIAAKLESPAADVMRVVNVLGRPIVNTSPPVYELQPAQYPKVKINDWTYTGMEKKIVIRRARKAFDELELPAGAEERVEMDKKEKEARAKPSVSPPDTPAALPAKVSAAQVPPKVSEAPGPSKATSAAHPAKVSPPTIDKPLPKVFNVRDMPPIKKLKKGESNSPPDFSGSLPPTKVSPPTTQKPLPSIFSVRNMAPIKKNKKPETESETESVSKSTKPVSNDNKPSETAGRAIKKTKPAPKTAFGKELEKHRAGKRGTSLPNSKRDAGVASPRPAAKSTLSKSTKPKAKVEKLSLDERRRRKADYSDSTSESGSSSESESEDEKPTRTKPIKKVFRAKPQPPAPVVAPAPATAKPDKMSPSLIALGLSLFGPEAEAEDAADDAARAAAAADAAAEAAVKAKEKAEAAAAKAAAMAAALKKRPAEDPPQQYQQQQQQQPLPKKFKVSPLLAHLGLPARPLEDCQIVDTNPLRAEPIARPRTGSQPSNGSGSPYINGYAMAMDRSRSSNGSASNPHSRQGSHPLNRSQNSTQTSFENPLVNGGPPQLAFAGPVNGGPPQPAFAGPVNGDPPQPAFAFAGPCPTLPQDEYLRERWQRLYPSYNTLVQQMKQIAHNAVAATNGHPSVPPNVEEFQKLAHKYQRWHTELLEIRVHFGGRSP